MCTGGYGGAPVPCMRILKFYALRIRRACAMLPSCVSTCLRDAGGIARRGVF